MKTLLRLEKLTFHNCAAPPPIGHKDATIYIRYFSSIHSMYLNLTPNLCSDCLSYPHLTRPAVPSTPRGEQNFVFNTLTINLYPPGGFGLSHQRGRVLQGSDAAPGAPPLDCPTHLICFVFVFCSIFLMSKGKFSFPLFLLSPRWGRARCTWSLCQVLRQVARCEPNIFIST